MYLATLDQAQTSSSLARRTALVAGVWFVLTFVFSIAGALLYGPVLDDPEYILGPGADTRIAAGALLEVGLLIANVATAVVLFPILKRVNEAVALGYVTLRVMESAIIAVGIFSLMSVVTLRQEFVGAGEEAATLTIAGQLLVALHDWTFLLGPQFCAGLGNGILLGYLMYRSALVPRRMALLGLIGGPLAFAGGAAVLLGAFEQPSPPLFVLTALEIAWEASLGVYLIVKGFRPSPILGGERDAAPITPVPAPAVG